MNKFIKVVDLLANKQYINLNLVWKIEENKTSDHDSKGVYIYIGDNPPYHLDMTLNEFIEKCSNDFLNL